MSLSKQLVYIPQGSISHIVTHLSKENSAVMSLDSWLSRIIGYPQHGWIELDSTKMSRLDFYYQISTQKAAQTAITLIPGETTYITLRILANKLLLDIEILEKLYQSSSLFNEARFVAQTYFIPKGIDEKELMTFLEMRSNTIYRKWKKHLKIEHISDREFKTLLIKASIVQKEAASKEEMPTVASVIENRLRKRMPLEMDGTLNYGKYSHIKITPKRIKEDKTHFNTYRHRGLPKEPIAMISFDALSAVLYPIQTDYLYFMRNTTGKHTFTKSYKEHLNVIRSVQKRNRKARK
jgi:UPF0755 protein